MRILNYLMSDTVNQTKIHVKIFLLVRTTMKYAVRESMLSGFLNLNT